MVQILETVLKHLDAHEIHYTWEEGWEYVRFDWRGKNGRWEIVMYEVADRTALAVYGILPIFTPEEKRTAMAELLARANYGLLLGNFELDFEDGEIRFRTSLDTNGLELPDEMIVPLLRANIAMMDHYLPAILQVAYGGTSAKEAVGQVENRQARPSELLEVPQPAGEVEGSTEGEPASQPEVGGVGGNGTAGRRRRDQRRPDLIVLGPKGVA
jgi:hypothetical protein